MSCAKKQEPATKPILVHLKSNGDCIGNMAARVREFSQGQLSDADVSAFWDCMGQAIQDYQSLTSGENQGDRYSPQGLRRFLRHYFIPDKIISDELLASAMELKRVFLGGTSAALTRDELISLQELMREMRALTLNLRPHARVLFRNQKQATDAEVFAASQALEDGTRTLGVWLNKKNQRYTFKQLFELVAAIRGANVVTGDQKLMSQIANVFPALKNILVGGDPDAIAGDEWLPLSRVIGKGCFLYLSAAYGLDENLDSALMRDSLSRSVLGALEILEQGARGQATGVILLSRWNALFVALQKESWLPQDVTADAVMQLWTWLLRRPLGDGVQEPKGMGPAQIALFKQQIQNWQTLLTTPVTSPDPLTQEFNAVLAASAAEVWDGQGRQILTATPPRAWPAASRRHLTWPFVLIRWLKTAYAGPDVQFLTEAQMNLAVEEVLPLLQNFGWLKNTKLTIGKRILREADLFTDAANGDGRLDVCEATRYLALVVSSLRSAQVWLTGADQLCGGRDAKCVRSLGEQPGFKMLEPFPRLASAVASWPAGKFALYMSQAEQTVLGQAVRGTFGTGDLLQSLMLMTYVEEFILRFDANATDRIDLQEATKAFDLYGPTLGRLLASNGVPPDQLMAFFTFMMKYGDTPFSMFGGSVAFIHWKNHHDSWAFEAERETLMSILNQLSKF